jgi:hypothetical protein
MHRNREPHQYSPEDLTILRCGTCSWRSKELTQTEMKDRGIPWYCDACGERAPHFIRFHPRERHLVDLM